MSALQRSDEVNVSQIHQAIAVSLGRRRTANSGSERVRHQLLNWHKSRP
jgi:hypothetical protein